MYDLPSMSAASVINSGSNSNSSADDSKMSETSVSSNPIASNIRSENEQIE